MLTDVLPLFRASLSTLGYTEHADPFDFENIPETILDSRYHLEVGTITGTSAAHRTHELNYPIDLRVFKKGFNDPNAARDTAHQKARDILIEILRPDNRLGLEIKDIAPSSIDFLPLNGSNDNAIIIKVEFNVKLIECFS